MLHPSTYISGMTWGWSGRRGHWTGPEAEDSMNKMKQHLSVNWVTLAFGALQDHPHATEIRFREHPTITDEELYGAIRHARSLGLKICMKPVVNCKDGTWRAHINFFDIDVPCEPKWSEWFASYNEYILHYARIAEETKCEMLCIGCEMVQTDRRETEWRSLIAEVRKVYSGIVTYNCDKYQETNVKWWDAVDVISSSGYYPIDDWENQLNRIEGVVRKFQKPFFFMEAGCPSREGSPFIPNDWSLKGQPSGEAQEAYYQTMFEHCDKREWVQGFMLWDWPVKLYSPESAPNNDDYCMYAKPAEAVVRNYYERKAN